MTSLFACSKLKVWSPYLIDLMPSSRAMDFNRASRPINAYERAALLRAEAYSITTLPGRAAATFISSCKCEDRNSRNLEILLACRKEASP